MKKYPRFRGRRTGRRSSNRSRGFYPKRRLSVVPYGTRSTIPRSLYSQVPNQMRLAMRASEHDYVTMTGNVPYWNFYSFVSPLPQPTGFTPWMNIYSRAFIDRVQVSVRFVPSTSTATDHATVADCEPIWMTSTVITYDDYGNLNTHMNTDKIAAMRRASSIPGAKHQLIAHPYAQNGTDTQFHACDVRQTLGGTREEHYAIKSVLGSTGGAPTITNPAYTTVVKSAPGIAVYLVSTYGTSTVRTGIMIFDFTYHITFTDPHAATLA